MKKVSCAQKILSSSLSLPFSSSQTYHPKIMSVFREIFETETGINNSIFSRSTICYRASAVASPVTSKVSNIGICIGLALFFFYGKWHNNIFLHWFSIVFFMENGITSIICIVLALYFYGKWHNNCCYAVSSNNVCLCKCVCATVHLFLRACL